MKTRLIRLADRLNHTKPGPRRCWRNHTKPGTRYCWSLGLCLYESERTAAEDGYLKKKPTLRSSFRLARAVRRFTRPFRGGGRI